MNGLTLAERFRVARRGAVHVDGERVRSSFAMPVPAGALLRLQRRFSSQARPQGLRLRSDADLVVGATRARDLTLWSTTAPDVVEVRIDTDGDTVVHLWNTWWADGAGHAWLGNAGFLVETDLTGPHPVVVVWCSDGVGPVTFDDLVVAIEIEVPVAPPAPGARTAAPAIVLDAPPPLPLPSIPTA